jgi:hypothetical protein
MERPRSTNYGGGIGVGAARALCNSQRVKEAELIALVRAMPECVEGSHFGTVDFRVRNKIFCTFPKPGEMVLKLAPEQQEMLVAAEGENFAPIPHGSTDRASRRDHRAVSAEDGLGQRRAQIAPREARLMEYASVRLEKTVPPRALHRGGTPMVNSDVACQAAIRLRLLSATWVSFLSVAISSLSVWSNSRAISDLPICCAQVLSVP